MSVIFRTPGGKMLYRNTMIDIGDGSYEEIKQAMEKVDKEIEEEEFERFKKMAERFRIEDVPTTEADRQSRVADLVENMRWEGLKDRLDDIRDLMHVNNLSLGALINLMLTMGTPMDADDRRSTINDDAKSAKEILDKMERRNKKTQKHLDNLMAELNALMGEE